MPRYGEAGVVSKSWQEDRPLASAAIPAGAVGLGAYKLNAGLRPQSAITGAQRKMQSAADDMVRQHKAQQAAHLKGHLPTGKHPLRLVNQKINAHRTVSASGAKLKSAERQFTAAAEAGYRQAKAKAIGGAKPRIRGGRVAMGSALAAAGGYGLYRRFVAPPPGGGGGGYGQQVG